MSTPICNGRLINKQKRYLKITDEDRRQLQDQLTKFVEAKRRSPDAWRPEDREKLRYFSQGKEI